MDKMEQLLQRLEAATLRLEGMNAASPVNKSVASTTPPTSTSTQIEKSQAGNAYDSDVLQNLSSFVDLSDKIGGLVKEQAGHVKNAFENVGNLIGIAGKSKKPTDQVLMDLLKPIQGEIEQIVAIKDKNRPSPFFNHLSAVAEGIPCLGWVTVSPTPAPFVEEMKGSAQFYSNRVIKENKEKGDEGKVNIDWCNAWVGVLGDLGKYVKQWHTTGLTWNANGGDAKSFVGVNGTSTQSAAQSVATPPVAPPTAPPSAGGPPGPPPPPPPPPSDYLDKFTPAPGGPATNDLFAELNKGAAVTAGLKHVDKSQMTHKNPALRASSVVPSVEKTPSAPAKAPTTAPAKPPRLEKDGNKWFIENYVGNQELTLPEEECDLKTSVYIYGLKNCGVKIPGKINAVTMDACTKTSLLLDGILATVEVVNCKSIQIQVLKSVPTISVDKTDGAQIFLPQETAEETEILSSKSSEMNLNFFQAKEDEWIEKAVPEQIRTKVVKGALVSEIVQHKA